MIQTCFESLSRKNASRQQTASCKKLMITNCTYSNRVGGPHRSCYAILRTARDTQLITKEANNMSPARKMLTPANT